jgi:hypothetical protein
MIATNLAAAKNWTRLDDSQDENNTTSFWNKATNFSQIVPHFSASCADVFFCVCRLLISSEFSRLPAF